MVKDSATYGYRRVWARLKIDGRHINHTMVYRVMRDEGWFLFRQGQEAADDWVQDYNEFRPHESLGDVAPMEFMPRKFVKEISSFELAT